MEYQKTITTEEMERLPLYSYPGKVVVVQHRRHLREALRQLRRFPLLGFDTETRPSFQKGEVHPVALLQLATEEAVYLLRLNRIGLVPEITGLLANDRSVKVGVGIRDDLRGLRQSRSFTPRQFIDLQPFARAFGIEEMSFAKLMSIIFGVHISKRQQTSNWEADTLTEAQVRYAATDAWGSLRMYEHLRSEGATGLY